jgi:integrase/recombinase XerD
MVRQVGEVSVGGPLAGYREGFAAFLAGRGYTRLSAANQLRLMAHLSRWLGDHGLDAGGLTSERAAAFLAARRGEGYRCWLSARGLAPLLGYLRGLGVAPPVPAAERTGPVEELLARYREYLVKERGLAAGTVGNYLREAGLFLATRVRADGLDLAGLTAGEVSGFVVGQCAERTVGAAKIMVTALRSVLRFLFVEGVVERDLVSAAPGVAGWRGSFLPKALEAWQVSALLRSCDRRRAVGRRDHAVLTVLLRLGLRASEVAALELGDIDWRHGELVVRGKGLREERLPLPVDVGEAIVAYLRRGRPRSACGRVFLRARAPQGGLSVAGVKGIVVQAGRRAGLPGVSAHRLRHTAATELLRAGASLAEVGQVLRHRSAATTAIYAKVDRDALRELAAPWPGGAA